MNLKYYSLAGATAFMAAATMLPLTASLQAAEVEQVQILTRGPVHEAFAESVSFDPVAGLIVTVGPPEAIEELPPEHQLEGDNVTWIPGYWAWDDDQNDFIWISGIWRNLPPGRQWVPGYWTGIDGGRYQWTPGYWTDATVNEVSYISTAPPRSIDSGPNIEAPSNNHNWVPGHWYWVDTRYVWRPGYWVPLRTNWTWVPSRYCWTRRGYVYVDGYWDYAVARRGVLFAPVYYHQHVYSQPNYSYTPSVVVSLNIFSDHLFVRPNSGHYYFGDYYAPRYRDAGFYASFSWHSDHHGYDPIYAYDRWEHREDRVWERRRLESYNYYRDHEEARPAHTWAAMREAREDQFRDGRNRRYADSLEGYARDSKSGQRFRKLDERGRQQLVSQRQEMRKFSQERRQMESRGTAAAGDSKKTAVREKITRSPIKGREPERLAKNEAPPQRPEAQGDKLKLTQPGKGKGGSQTAQERKDGARGEEKREENSQKGTTEQRVEQRKGEPMTDKNATPQKQNRGGESQKIDRQPPRKEIDGNKKQSLDNKPRKESPAKSEARSAPQKKKQAAPQSQEKSKPQVHEAPRRDSQPKPQANPSDKKQSTPQQKGSSSGDKRKKTEEETNEKKG